MKIWDVMFRDERGKNFETLSELEIRPIDRKKVLEDLDVADYSEGPFEDTLYKGADMWVFGKTIKNREVYIKISLGEARSNVICISFHLAEYKMTYPFKK
ncbi:toxin [Proteiniphilum sp.]|uniref:toxin n=1 Tax=Proteiniphilum sp. TaxID=1926877 RepID=UPI00332C1B3F